MYGALRSVSVLVILLSLRVDSIVDGDGNRSATVGNRSDVHSEKPRGTSSHNLTFFLGYANNPFGPPTRLHRKMENILNVTFKNPMPELNRIVVDGPLENNLVEEQISRYESRSKRGVVQLYNMVSCSTGCNPLIYKGYGCYCGFLGSGDPVDGIDKCCKYHDWCYDTANCPMYLEYIVPYYWKCYRGRSLCAIDHHEFGGSGSCAQRLCECDRVLSECLSRFPCPKSRAVCTSSPWRFLQNTFMIF